jgi:hypothetical protein
LTAVSCRTRGDEGKVRGIHSTGDDLEAWLTETERRQWWWRRRSSRLKWIGGRGGERWGSRPLEKEKEGEKKGER